MSTGIEASVIKAGATQAFKWVASRLEDWQHERRNDTDKNNARSNVASRLQKSAIDGYERFSYISSIALPKQRAPLNDIYVQLTLATADKKNQFEIDGFPDELFRKSANKVLVVDSAGAGKSTLSKRIYTRALDEKKLIPILIDLRRFRDVEDIASLICQDFMIELDYKNILLSLIQEGKFLFILDGFDEIPEQNKGAAANALRAFIDGAEHSCFLLTSRPEIGIAAFSDFKQFAIRPLNLKQAYELLGKLDDGGDVSTRLIEKLKGEQGESVRSFLENPLLTSLLYKAFEYKTTIPIKKNVFYRQVYDALFESHDLTKEPGFNREKFTALHVDDFHRALRAIAAVFHNHGVTETTKDEFVAIANEALGYCLDLKIQPSDLLKDLLGPVPLFVEDGPYVRWSHKSLLDYFLAEFFVRDFEGVKGEMLKGILDDDNPQRFENFIEILHEIDPIVVATYFILPLFERVIHRMKEIESLIPINITENQKNIILSIISCYEVIVVQDKEMQERITASRSKNFNTRLKEAIVAAGVDQRAYRPILTVQTLGETTHCTVTLIRRKLAAILIVRRLKNLESLPFSRVMVELNNQGVTEPKTQRRHKVFAIVKAKWLQTKRKIVLERLYFLLNSCHIRNESYVSIYDVPRIYESMQLEIKGALKTRESFKL